MKKPILTITLIVINVLMFVLTLGCGTDIMFNAFGMYQGALGLGELPRIFTSAFIHNGIIHLGCNMMCLFYFGRQLELRISRFKYFLICLGSIVVSGIFIDMVGGYGVMHGGASGLVFGLMGATFVMEYFNGMDYSNTIKGIIINLVASFFCVGISWQGHLGGLVGGLVLGLLFCKNVRALYVSELFN